MDILNGTDSLERRLIYSMAEKHIPVNGSIELTPLCSMDCNMCYVRLSEAEMRKKGRLRTAGEWLSVCEEMKRAGVLFLLLTGGEPLLYPGFRELYTGLRDMGMILTVNTNGTMLTENWADFFAEHRPRRVNITLYGAGEETYGKLCHYAEGFHKALRAAALLQARGIDLRLHFTLTRDNAQDMERFVRIAEDMGIPWGIDPYVMPAVRERSRPFDEKCRLDPEESAACRLSIRRMELESEEDFSADCRKIVKGIQENEAFFASRPEERIPKRGSCLAGQCSFTLNWQGEMRPCVVLDHPRADVFEIGFEAAWRKIAAGMRDMLLNEACSVCPVRGLCFNCAASALHESGSEGGFPEYLCRQTKELYRLMKKEAGAE